MILYLKYESEKMKRHPKQANTQICEARMMKVIQLLTNKQSHDLFTLE